jgi:protein O-mannosyl-transferase
VTLKSPTNGRGLMNYGLALMERGDYAAAIDLFERALVFTPNYALLHVNLGIAYGGVKRTADAERAFKSAQGLAPDDWRSHYYLARWLGETGRIPEAVTAATRAVQLNAADETSQTLLARLSAASAAVAAATAADELVARSLAQHRAGQFRESLASAQAALRLRPDYAAAWNNAAAAHIAMGEYDQGIVAAEAALRLDATLQIARNNLAFARAEKARQPARPPAAGSLPRG